MGILAAHCANARGAKRIIMIDNQTYRLEFATSKIPGLETVNFAEKKVMETLKEMTGGHGPDVAIEAVGFHYCKSWTHAIETALMLETDPSEMLNEMIVSVRKVRRDNGKLTYRQPGKLGERSYSSSRALVTGASGRLRSQFSF